MVCFCCVQAASHSFYERQKSYVFDFLTLILFCSVEQISNQLDKKQPKRASKNLDNSLLKASAHFSVDERVSAGHSSLDDHCHAMLPSDKDVNLVLVLQFLFIQAVVSGQLWVILTNVIKMLTHRKPSLILVQWWPSNITTTRVPYLYT